MPAGTVVSVNVSDGGVPKLPVPEASVTVNGLKGDRQRDRHFHGGPKRAVCLYSLEELTAYAHPCSNLVPYFRDGKFVRVSQKVHPGSSRVYAKVLEEGLVRPGDPVEIHSAALSGELLKGSVPERIRNP